MNSAVITSPPSDPDARIVTANEPPSSTVVSSQPVTTDTCATPIHGIEHINAINSNPLDTDDMVANAHEPPSSLLVSNRSILPDTGESSLGTSDSFNIEVNSAVVTSPPSDPMQGLSRQMNHHHLL